MDDSGTSDEEDYADDDTEAEQFLLDEESEEGSEAEDSAPEIAIREEIEFHDVGETSVNSTPFENLPSQDEYFRSCDRITIEGGQYCGFCLLHR